MKLFLKGERCHTEKCAIERRNVPPGPQRRARRPKKMMGYGLQLREKQKARRVYGILERQFRRYYEKAAQMKGITGENLLSLLERRLDNVVYRMGFGTSRAQARQFVRHGHILVNGRKVNIPSFQVKQGDAIEVQGKEPEESDHPGRLRRHRASADSELAGGGPRAMKGRVIGMPRRDELVQIQLNEQLIVELYSK